MELRDANSVGNTMMKIVIMMITKIVTMMIKKIVIMMITRISNCNCPGQ